MRHLTAEKTYNALRLAMALQKDQSGTEVLVFLMADAVTAALPAQGTPQGYNNIECMVSRAFCHCWTVQKSAP